MVQEIYSILCFLFVACAFFIGILCLDFCVRNEIKSRKKFKRYFGFSPPLFHKRFCENSRKIWMQIFVSDTIQKEIQKVSLCDDKEEESWEITAHTVTAMIKIAKRFRFSVPACVVFWK